MIVTPVHFPLATGSYLRALDGRTRCIHGLEEIARAMLADGVRVMWGLPPHNKAACAYWWRSLVVLAPWLYDCRPADIRYSLLHEYGHCLVGPNDERVRAWMLGRYRELLGCAVSPH